MAYSVDNTVLHGNWLTIHLTGEAVAASNLANIPNPEGVDVLVTRMFLYIETPSALAATLHLGWGATGADVHDFIDGFALNNAAGTAWSFLGGPGVNVHAADIAMVAPVARIWLSTEFLSLTQAAFASTGLDAYLFIEYVRLP